MQTAVIIRIFNQYYLRIHALIYSFFTAAAAAVQTRSERHQGLS